jgi:succinate dehydrogenase/fumarate reductase cytochrome b subunit
MERDVRSWRLPWIVVVLYPGLLLTFDGAINSYHRSGSVAMAFGALLTMLLASSIPPLALRALLMTRHPAGPVLRRGMLYLMFSVPTLFSLCFTLSRFAGSSKPIFFAIWISAWLAVGLMLHLKGAHTAPNEREQPVAWLRIVHGVTALVLLCGFLLVHLTNHGLAMWSVELHDAVLQTLRQWYRSEWIEPVLLTLLLVMIGTGVPMVLRHSRHQLDAFRVVQLATGAYVAVFICSHVIAVLNGRRLGIETDWFFAAGPASLLDGSSLLGRLIPHYLFGTLCLIVHVGCGLRIVLLQHGISPVLSNRALYGVASVGMAITLVIMTALLGFHIKAPG